MIISDNKILNIYEIEKFVHNFSKNLKKDDVILLKGELGSGKTTFARSLINELYFINNLPKPKSISSPTYPILLTYDLNSFEIYHYDLYRINNVKELEELDIMDNIKKSITIIEWPKLLLDLPFNHKYYQVNLEIHSENERNIKIEYFE